MSVSGFTAIAPTNYPANSRILVDAAKVATGTLPATATTSNTGVIDLQNITPYPTTETINVGVAWTASANGNASAANGSIVLYDSADNSSFAAISTLGSVPIVSAATIAAGSYTFKLPPGCRRYIMAVSTMAAGTGNVADSVLTLQLLF
jgi:hypothetical protein